MKFLFLILCFNVFAAAPKSNPYSVPMLTQVVYDEIKTDNKTIFLIYSARWARIDIKQNQMLDLVMGDFKKKAHFYTVDPDAMEGLKVPDPGSRTTIIAVRDDKIRAKLVGVTDSKLMTQFIDQNL
ncbi:MAG: hypothetical protein JNM93_04615 [Bacteriovoracaceae bacterium]|nr:hypothetical protein [Bacteriovoracaceae bacterium]